MTPGELARRLGELGASSDVIGLALDALDEMKREYEGAEQERKRRNRERVAKHRAEKSGNVTVTAQPITVTAQPVSAEKPNDFSREHAPAHVVKASTSYEVGSREDNHTTLPRGRAAVDDLENRLREAAGYQHSPHPKLMMLAPILGLLDQGMSLDEDVLPVIRSKATQLRQHGRPDAVSWEFFRNAIVEHHHARKRAIVVPFSTAGPRQQPETQMELVRRVLAEGKT